MAAPRLAYPPARAGWRPLLITYTVSVLAAAALTACQPAASQADTGAAPPPEVPVAAVVERTIDSSLTQIGRVEAAQRVDVLARVAGHIDAVLFREGDAVRAGQPLFRIDARPFEAAVARADAQVRLAQARESLTRSEAERARQLARDAAIAAEELERRVAAHAEAQARSAAAAAALRSAELDREFAVVRSPINGRIGRALVTAGNFVGVGGSQSPLASIVSVDPLHVHFDVSDARVLERAARQRNGEHWQARILDGNNQQELARARVDFVDNEVVANTGTLRLRARIDAPDARLIPGQFVRVQLSAGSAQPSLLVPDQAVGTDQGRRFVLVVEADGKVAYRSVEVGTAHDGLRVVTSGVAAGEQVVTSALMRVRPGMTVKPSAAAAQAPQAQASSPLKS